MSRPDLVKKREEQRKLIAGLTVNEPFGSRWSGDTTGEPDILYAFYFHEGLGPGRLTADEFNALQKYISATLDKRRGDLQLAQSLLRVAACSNDVNAVARFRLLVDSLNTIIGAFQDFHKQTISSFSNNGLAAGLPG